jgi:uncharacterized protein (TIGR03435 family)
MKTSQKTSYWIVLLAFLSCLDSAAAQVNGSAADDTSLGPEFEVATIRPANPNQKNTGNYVASLGRFEGRGTTLKGLVGFAYTHWYSFGGEQVGSEGPAWTTKERFDVEAKLSDQEMSGWGTLTERERIERVRPILRRLLADRFHVQVSQEQRVTEVYVLVQAKGGSKLKEVAPPPPPVDETSEESRQRQEEARAQKATVPGTFTMSGDKWSGTSLDMFGLAVEIAGNAHLDAPLVNLTGLNGYYDFTMNVSWDKDSPPLLDQVEQQLGLRVEPRKIPLTYYIITSADEPSLDGA